jgi:hypothetical protein
VEAIQIHAVLLADPQKLGLLDVTNARNRRDAPHHCGEQKTVRFLQHNRALTDLQLVETRVALAGTGLCKGVLCKVHDRGEHSRNRVRIGHRKLSHFRQKESGRMMDQKHLLDLERQATRECNFRKRSSGSPRLNPPAPRPQRQTVFRNQVDAIDQLTQRPRNRLPNGRSNDRKQCIRKRLGFALHAQLHRPRQDLRNFRC